MEKCVGLNTKAVQSFYTETCYFFLQTVRYKILQKDTSFTNGILTCRTQNIKPIAKTYFPINEFQSWCIGGSVFLSYSFDTQYKLYKALKSVHELLLVHTFVFCAIQQIGLQLITTSNLVMARIDGGYHYARGILFQHTFIPSLK